MHKLRHLILLAAITAATVTFAPIHAVHAASPTANTPAELSASDAKNRASYNTALTQLHGFMRHKQVVSSYEDTVDAFQIYRDKVSRQEIGATLYKMYSRVGPRPAKKYFGDKAVAADKAAAAALAAQKAEATAQAQAAAQAAAAAQAKAAATAAANSAALSNNNTYVNSDGNTVHSPAYSTNEAVPAGATAKCNDGTYSFSQHHSGTCSGHGGVASWL